MAGNDFGPILINGHTWFAVRGTTTGQTYNREDVIAAGGQVPKFQSTRGYPPNKPNHKKKSARF